MPQGGALRHVFAGVERTAAQGLSEAIIYSNEHLRLA
jgi:hypothetical protein